MNYATLMVHLDLAAANEALLRITGDLAEIFGANVIGIAACHPVNVVCGYAHVSRELIDQDRRQIAKEMRAAEEGFRAALRDRVPDLQWRSTTAFSSLADYIAREARAADLLITGPDNRGSTFAPSRQAELGDLVLRLGRPMLIIPTATARLDLAHVVIGWKDRREARRAVWDAMPLLVKAGKVTVVEITAKERLTRAQRHVTDVAERLKRHGINAEPLALPRIEGNALQLDRIADEMGAGLIVAGAYGHARLREWILGGMTRDLLLRPHRATLLSH
jgi:nucleotide-binding universal stress UspA family protein